MDASSESDEDLGDEPADKARGTGLVVGTRTVRSSAAMSKSLVVVALPFLTLLGACSSCRNDKPAPETADAASAATPADAGAVSIGDAGAFRRPVFGVPGMLLTAARAQSLTDVQRAKLDEVALSLTGERAERRAEENELRGEVLSAVKSGKVDNAKLQSQYAAVEQAARARADDEAEALAKIHTTLDPAQRKAVAADVKAKITARRENAKPKDKPKDKDKGKPGDPRMKRRVERLERDLGLDPAQKTKLDAMVAARSAKWDADDEWKRQLAVLSAFEEDGFDAKKAAAAEATAGKPRTPIVVEDAKFYLELAPALRPDQREKLAIIMEVGDRPGRRGRPGSMPPVPGMPAAPPGIPGMGDGHGHGHGHGGPPGQPSDDEE